MSSQQLLLALGTSGGGGGGGLALGGHNVGSGSGTAITTASTTTAASASTFVIGVHAGVSPSSVSDNKGNTYTRVGGSSQDATAASVINFYYVQNGAGGAGHTATANFGSSDDASVFLLEITGAATASFDQTARVRDTASPFTVTSPTLSQADEMIVCLIGTQSGSNPATYSESTGFTIADQSTNGVAVWTAALAYKVVSSTTAITPSFTCTGGTDAGLILCTFKKA